MTQLLSPVGRIVWGNPLTSQNKTNMQTKQPIIGKDGQPVKTWSFGLAISRAEFASVVWPIMAAEAMKLFPNGSFPPAFAWKYKDGDGVDDKGKPFNTREGYGGNIILSISTEIAATIRIFRLMNNAYVQMTEGVKTGDYVRATLDIQAHPPNKEAPGSQAGLYINPVAVEFVGYGTEIVSGADPDTLFGGAAPALPPGASATPIATPSGIVMPGVMPGGVAPSPGTPFAPAVAPAATIPAGVPSMPGMGSAPLTAYPSSAPQMPSAAPVQPAPDFVANATGIQPAAGVPRIPVAFDPTNGRPIFGYNPANGQPLYA